MLLVRLHVDYIDLLKLKAYKIFEISDADLSWLLFYRSQLVDNNIIVDGEECEGTSDLWELIVSENPDDNIYSLEIYNNYAKLVLKINALHRNNDPSSKYPESSKGL